MASMEKLLTEALALPENERARLAHELLLRLDPQETESTAQLTAERDRGAHEPIARHLREQGGAADIDDVDEYVAEQIAAARL